MRRRRRTRRMRMRMMRRMRTIMMMLRRMMLRRMVVVWMVNKLSPYGRPIILAVGRDLAEAPGLRPMIEKVMRS